MVEFSIQINLSKKELSKAERSLLEKGPKFAITPLTLPYKRIVAEVGAAIISLPDESKERVHTNVASALDRARLPTHKNISKEEKYALNTLTKDHSRLVLKADKWNCFVVMDKNYHERKMETILNDENSTLYNTSRFLTEILSPLENKNGFSLKNSSQFSKEMANLSIDKDDVMVSFDVISLFTAIPVTKACTYIKSKLNRDPTLPLQTNLTVDDIILLMEFTLSNNGDTSSTMETLTDSCMAVLWKAPSVPSSKIYVWKRSKKRQSTSPKSNRKF